jgi:hypothetical protein
MSLSNNFPAVRPTLLLDFASARRLDPRITFTRATTATYYDGVTRALAEQNLFLYSQEFNQADWAQSGVTVSANSSIAPDGTVTADSIIPTAVSGQFKELQQNFLATSGLTYAFSIFLKADGYDFVQLVGTSATFGTFAINYDLSTGVETQFSAGTSTVVSRSITAFGSGWYRVSVVTTAIGTGAARLAFNVIPTSTSARGVTWTGDGGSGVAAWGAQIEQRGTVTAYTVTTTAVVSNYQPVLVTAAAGVARFDFNPVTDVSLGLLIEEARTNLLTYSTQFDNPAWAIGAAATGAIVANQIVSPDGTVSADLFYDLNSTLNDRVIGQVIALTTATSYTLSCYVKSAGNNFAYLRVGQDLTPNNIIVVFNLLTGAVGSSLRFANANSPTIVSSSITNVGNNFYRILVTVTTSVTANHYCQIGMNTTDTTNVDYTGNGWNGIYIWGAQLEVGSFATSYIPTTAGPVPRNADVAVMTGTNFLSWYNNAQGTLFGQAISNTNTSTGGNPVAIASISDGTANNRIQVRYTSNVTTFAPRLVASGVSIIATAAGTVTRGVSYKQALAYQSGNTAVAGSGAVIDSSALAYTLVGVTSLEIGTGSTSEPTNGTISKIAYYDIRLTNAQLQALTQS